MDGFDSSLTLAIEAGPTDVAGVLAKTVGIPVSQVGPGGELVPVEGVGWIKDGVIVSLSVKVDFIVIEKIDPKWGEKSGVRLTVTNVLIVGQIDVPSGARATASAPAPVSPKRMALAAKLSAAGGRVKAFCPDK